MKTISLTVIGVLAFILPLNAENEATSQTLQNRIERIDGKQRVVQLLASLGIIDSPKWKKAESLLISNDGDLGRFTYVFRVTGNRDISKISITTDGARDRANSRVDGFTISGPKVNYCIYNFRGGKYTWAYSGPATHENKGVPKSGDGRNLPVQQK